MPNFPSPLPLAAFEEYMFRDDRPKYPMGIIARLRFSGRLDPQAAEIALRQVVARHPLLRAKIQRTSWGRLAWAPADDYLPTIHWLDGPQHDRLPLMRPIDLCSGPGMRVWAAADTEQSCLSLQVHHAVCDGKAVLQVAGDFLRGYAQAVDREDARVEQAPCDAAVLGGRGTFGLTPLKYLRMLPAQLMGLSRVWKFFMQRPVPVLKRITAVCSELPTGYPEVKAARLEATELQELSAAAAEAGVTLNDWLLCDFFVAIDDFRARQQATTPSEWIRVSVPINLRQEAHRRMSAANLVSMVFLDRTGKQIADSLDLLRSIHEEMDSIRRRQLGLIFILALWIVRSLPGGLAKWVNRNCCETTCVLSNLGRAMADSPLPRSSEMKIVAGNVVLDGIDFFTPIRDGTSVAMALIYYAGGLQLCMQYDSRHITSVQADDLMATYLRRIRTSLDRASRSVQGKAA